ncbi:MAG TPA: hypothetical protein VFZ21_31680 [Gemmatimonadaceae bacterium]|nr:hypothetical protein [Gemmatimonadaceae bacterium]
MEPAAAPFFPKCAGVPGFPDSCEQEAMGVSELCGDCQSWLNEPARDLSPLDARIREARDKLRADLDRPLPPAALRTWPEHWSNPGWES